MPSLRPLSRAVAAVEAYTLGRRVAEEWRNGRLDWREVRAVREREGFATVALAAGVVGLTAWHLARNRFAWPMVAAGVLVGSGAAAVLAERVGLDKLAHELWPGPPIEAATSSPASG